ncbi:hypothetical protein WH5701_16138 [Synechococcus sp. WH 5701]|nr:hypothetical protein WH5701_16138 [Synechococcus sp. WH 5701]
MLQTMAKFMEERFHFFEAHQARGVFDGRGLIANQVGHRQHMGAVGVCSPSKAFIHPGPTAFAGRSAVGIEIKRGKWGAVLPLHAEITNVLMPDRSLPIGGFDHHIKKPVAEPKEAIKNLRQREPWTKCLLIQIKPLLA